jgi:DNA-binding transcriptional ArsR family regulator
MKEKDKGGKRPNRTIARGGVPHPRAADWIKALNAPQRRRILRTLHDVGEARSPNELAEGYELSVSHVSYHVKVLKEYGALALTDTAQKRGAVEHFYASTVMSNELVIELLEATRADDE